MADSHVVSGLKAKEAEIKKRISDLKKEVKAYQDELAAVSKTLRIFGENPRTGANKLPCIIFDALREARPAALGIGEIADAVVKAEGIEAQDPETIATVRQRCLMAMYRYYDKGKVIKERRSEERVWRLA
jgi:hypothetical protein